MFTVFFCKLRTLSLNFLAMIVQDGSIWLFTAEKFEGSRPFTVQASYEGFSEGVSESFVSSSSGL